jgi:hypothetical protein
LYKIDTDDNLNIPRFLLKDKMPLLELVENLKKRNADLSAALEEIVEAFNGKDYEKGFWPTMDKAVEALEKHKEIMKEFNK